LDKYQRLDILLERQLFDRYVTRFVDGILPISEFLISKIKEVNFKGEILKIPPICDYREINKVQIINTSETYFLYVGYFIYKWAISFVIKSFESLADNNCYLHLVINGGSQQLADLQSEINTSIKKDKIILLSKLSYQDLISQYKNACALLIPLESRIRDLARFPQKISEYLASERPIVTTANGEIKYYFIDGENALISQSEDIVEFSSKMEIAINQPELAKEIGRKGYDTGLKYFDIDSYRNSLREFVANLCNKKSKK
jgi:glycosyltransferase involved in cell wall biosynthesis